jgi:protein gp37
MSDNTGIDYLDATWNPIIMRCDRVGTGCANCWHLPMAKRHAANPTRPESHRAAYSGGPFVLSETALTLPMKWKKPRRIGVQFMGDLYHKDVPFEWIDRVKAVEALCPQHTFIELTKRPERMAEYLSDRESWVAQAVMARDYADGVDFDASDASLSAWPLPNVHLGTSIENQEAADERIPHLLKCPAAVRFLSVEPMLGPINLTPHMTEITRSTATEVDETILIDWVIVGGESGPNARPMHTDWVRSIRDQCQAAGVAFFFKQWGEWRPLSTVGGRQELPFGEYILPTADHPGFGFAKVGKAKAGRLLDGREWNQLPETPKVG